jgi:hypothetical protein
MVKAERSKSWRWLRWRALMLVIAGVLTVVTSVTPAHAGISVKRNDYNRDGISDLVAILYEDGCLYRWNGNGSGGFGAGQAYGHGWSPHAYAAGVGDINGDGVGDLVAERRDPIQHIDVLNRWFGTGSGGFTYAGPVSGSFTDYTERAGVGDINSDGGAGDIVGRRISDSALFRSTGTGSGNFKTAQLAIGFFTMSYDPQ